MFPRCDIAPAHRRCDLPGDPHHISLQIERSSVVISPPQHRRGAFHMLPIHHGRIWNPPLRTKIECFPVVIPPPAHRRCDLPSPAKIQTALWSSYLTKGRFCLFHTPLEHTKHRIIGIKLEDKLLSALGDEHPTLSDREKIG